MRPLLVPALVGIGLVSGCVGGGRATGEDAGTEAGAEAATRVAHSPAPPPVRSAQPEPDPAAAVDKGRALYGRYCNFCHGESGQGYAADEAPAIASDDLLAIASDGFLESAILRGRPGTTMSAWGVARGGPLGPAEASAIIAFIRSFQKRPAEALAPRDAAAGDPKRGAPVYAARCASCHGPKGRGGKYVALANPELLASATDAFLASTIERGRAGTPMQAFAGKLGYSEIDDVVALLRSWQTSAELTLDLPPKPGELKSVVLNPRGPQPAFDPKADFVPVDAVKRELDRKATMVIVDARAPGDYAQMHVAGSISVPFYQVEAFAPQIPKDRYVLTYCACPHASSVRARDALRALGYARVAVLDEGILAWRDRGYPVRGGAKP